MLVLAGCASPAPAPPAAKVVKAARDITLPTLITASNSGNVDSLLLRPRRHTAVPVAHEPRQRNRLLDGAPERFHQVPSGLQVEVQSLDGSIPFGAAIIALGPGGERAQVGE